MARVGVLLDPRLGLSPAEFVEAWNAAGDLRAPSVATMPDAREARDFSVEVAVQVVIDLVIGVGGAALYDMIRAVIRRAKGDDSPVKVEPIAGDAQQQVVHVHVDVDVDVDVDVER